jgi:hypothetical protein
MRPALTWLSLAWWKENIDTVSVILVVITMSILGTTNVVSPDTVVQTLPAILGVLALAMLRDRFRSRQADRHLESVAMALDRVDQKIDRLPAVRVLDGNEVGDCLAKARQDTTIWFFRGGTGTHTRAVTLPDCIALARPDRRGLQVRIEILDPTKPDVCDEYAALYRRLATGPEDDASTWTGEGTRRESYATVLAACWYKQQYAPLKIEVGLTEMISTFRYDVSSRYLIVTQRGPRFQAMLVERSKPHYDYWAFELDMSFDQSRQIPVNAVASRYPLTDQPDTDQVRRLFQELSVDLPSEYTDDDVREIITRAIVPRSNPVVRGAGELAGANSYRW